MIRATRPFPLLNGWILRKVSIKYPAIVTFFSKLFDICVLTRFSSLVS